MKKTLLTLSIIGIVSLTAADLFAWGRGNGSGYCGGSGSGRSGYHMGYGDRYMRGSGMWDRDNGNGNYGRYRDRNNMDPSDYDNSRYNLKKNKPAGDI